MLKILITGIGKVIFTGIGSHKNNLDYMRSKIHNILHESVYILDEKRKYGTNYIFAQDVIEKYKDDPTIYIQFSNLEKVGVYPMTHKDYYTPAGIYTYPLKALTKYFFVGDKEKDYESNGFDIEWDEFIGINIPFAGDRKFIHFFKDKFYISSISSTM
jgi:hypothetical protein